MQYSPELYRFVMKNAALIEEARQMLEDEDAQQCVPESYALVSRNRRLIEDAYAVLEDIDGKLLLAIKEYVKEYINANKKSIKDEVYFYEHEGAIVFGKKRWRKTIKGYPDFGFWFSYDGADGDASWLRFLTGQISGGRTGFYFWINYRKVLDFAKGKKFLEENFSEVKKKDSDKFDLVEGSTSIVYPFLLDMRKLIAGIPENDAKGYFKNKLCFTGIEEALAAIVKRIDVFDALVQKALDLNK